MTFRTPPAMPDRPESGMRREPHIRQIRRLNQCKLSVFGHIGPTRRWASAGGLQRYREQRRLGSSKADLLPVINQHLVAVRAYLWTVLLKARQNNEIALIHQRAAKLLNVAGAGFLLLIRATVLALALGKGGAGCGYGQQGKYH
jgi:hypothetical protein